MIELDEFSVRSKRMNLKSHSFALSQTACHWLWLSFVLKCVVFGVFGCAFRKICMLIYNEIHWRIYSNTQKIDLSLSLYLYMYTYIMLLNRWAVCTHTRTKQCHACVFGSWREREQPEQRRVPKANERVIRSSLYGWY